MISNAAYAPLDLRSLSTDLPLICDLYIKERGQYVLYREASLPFTLADRERLLASGVSDLWIRVSEEEGALSQQRLAGLLALPDEQVPPLAKAGLLYGSARAIAHRALANISSASLANLEELISATVGFMALSKTAFSALLAVMHHDFSVYTHAVNVAVYALGLGRSIGITDPRHLQHLGCGAILHDAGKARVPKEMLTKRGPLSPEEWATMRQHPNWGVQLLSTADLSEAELAIIAQHHERLDGSGYPAGIAGEDLHPFSIIVGLVNAYDSLTSDRPYRSPRAPFNALSHLKEEMVIVGKLDPAMFASLVLLLGYPSQAGAAQELRASGTLGPED